MSRPDRPSLRQDIVALESLGFSRAEIARRLGCTPANISQSLRRNEERASPVLMPSQAGLPARRKPPVVSLTCNRPDARKGFDPCGDPKKRTACGELLGVCDYHFETTKPLGGMKL